MGKALIPVLSSEFRVRGYGLNLSPGPCSFMRALEIGSCIRSVFIALLCMGSFSFAAQQKQEAIIIVNLNTATRTELIQIPRIGESMAERIVEFRKANGPFKRIEEIMNVRGMGEKTFLSIKPYLTVGSQGSQSPQGNQGAAAGNRAARAAHGLIPHQ